MMVHILKWRNQKLKVFFNKIHSIYYYSILAIVNKMLVGTHFFKAKFILLNLIGIKLGEGTKIVAPIKMGRMAKLTIGKNCWIGSNFMVHGNGIVKVGDNCDLGPDIAILTGSHEISNQLRRAGKGITYNTDIGDGVWIGGKTTIINGANLEDGVVIGACSLINKDCERDAIYFGHPAKLYKTAPKNISTNKIPS